MDKFKKYASTLVFIIIISLFAIMRGPTFYNNWKWEGEKLPELEVFNYKTNNKEILFQDKQIFIILFWASWCGPCMIEFSRYKKSILDKKIPLESVYAINPFETSESIIQFMKKEDYPFQFVADQGVLARKLDIRMTPTSILVKNQKIVKMDSGISPLGVTSAESLFTH